MDTKPKIKIRRRRGGTPPRDSPAKVFILQHHIEIQTMDKPPTHLKRYRKISGTEYVDTVTNEKTSYKVRDGTNSKPSNLNRKFSALRRLINNNFIGSASELHIVLTYGGDFAGKMTDPKKLYEDFRRFWDRFKRKYPMCAYIAIAEPQRTGSWHMHVLMKRLDNNPLYIPKDQLDELWGHGFTWVSSLEGNDNIGVYFMAHLKNVDLYENDDQPSDKKCIIKGARLALYPPKFKLYRCSKGILKPSVSVMPYEETKLLTEGYRPTFSQTLTVMRVNEDGTEDELNSITYEHYKF